jgi:hypothetical protein
MQQLGFDIEYTDPITHEAVPWADATAALVDAIRTAPWKIVDIETTGLTPFSKELNFTGKELTRGVNPRLRLRVLSVYFPEKNGSLRLEGFDFDRMTQADRKAVCEAAMTNAVFGHNVGFDAYWIREYAQIDPTYLLDSMLLSRLLVPDVPIRFAQMCGDENEDETFREYAEMLFAKGKSGWALADLSAVLLGKILPKEMQGPKNWAQPFLTKQGYDYATGDSLTTYQVLAHILGLEPGEDLLEKYLEVRAQRPDVGIVEPQVLDVVRMREHGMPWSQEEAEKYVLAQWVKVAEHAKKMCEIEPKLEKFLSNLSNADEGINEELKKAMGEAFESRGVVLSLTEKTGLPMIGEKDLRKAKAQDSELAASLFKEWVALNKAKKAGKMAVEVSQFAKRAPDLRIHSLTGHGPVTGRLSSSEPNVQQFPRDQGFRNCVTARPGHKIMASDYSALDMRVGAALAIRAQREIMEAYMGDRKVQPYVYDAISRVIEGKVTLVQALKEEAYHTKRFLDHKAKTKSVPDSASGRKAFWEEYRNRNKAMTVSTFIRCYAYVRDKAKAAGTGDWGMLRDAFAIPGMDIHTWTALGMNGQDPAAMFGGLSDADVATALKKSKKELGDKRQTGKVGNLSLLYKMQTLGLVDAAAKNYNIHWAYEEADKVRIQWLQTYVEIDLWHTWTELTPVTTVYVPDPERGMRYVKKAVYESKTLGGRVIYAFGLNAALAFSDQSTGADIVGDVMTTLWHKHNPIFKTIVNQVHDEIVFEIPDEYVEAFTKVVADEMVASAEKFLMPYGVKGECSPATGQVWLKD